MMSNVFSALNSLKPRTFGFTLVNYKSLPNTFLKFGMRTEKEKYLSSCSSANQEIMELHQIKNSTIMGKIKFLPFLFFMCWDMKLHIDNLTNFCIALATSSYSVILQQDVRSWLYCIHLKKKILKII